MVQYIVEHYGLALMRACRLVKQPRSAQYYRSVKDPKLALRQRMRELAQVRVRYGYRRLHILLKREGWQLGKNQTYRLYRKEQLQLRTKLPRRRKMVVTRIGRPKPTRPNEAWSMDFVADQLADGGRFRCLTVVDVYTREGLAIEVGASLRATHVVEVLNRLVVQRARRRAFWSITAVSFPGCCSISGPITDKQRSISAVPASRPTTASSRLPTARSATSA